VPLGLSFSADAQEFKASLGIKSKLPKSECRDLRDMENLGFCFDDLITSLRSGEKPVKILSKRVAEQFFELQLKDVKVMGYPRNVSHKVIYVTVSGTGSEFQSCVERIIKLANAKNNTASTGIIARFTTNLRGKVRPEEYFQQYGIRYHLQSISGVPTFHCTNARADDRAIIRAQPG
jgi:hypothetical protein